MAASHTNPSFISPSPSKTYILLFFLSSFEAKAIPIEEKWKSFGWNVIEIDGHNFEEIINGFNEAEGTKEKPTMVIAKTIKGKGVSFMENEASWHGVAPKDEEKERALEELGGAR